ncbi:hypothetical protein N483_07850 [Pseudoalteromonas luteoviolacea NCIMB 1944]|nr:hypothetical protein N483_07850 [Pseudoalteromonas luteoviolacea NCIMB 1944]
MQGAIALKAPKLQTELRIKAPVVDAKRAVFLACIVIDLRIMVGLYVINLLQGM